MSVPRKTVGVKRKSSICLSHGSRARQPRVDNRVIAVVFDFVRVLFGLAAFAGGLLVLVLDGLRVEVGAVVGLLEDEGLVVDTVGDLGLLDQ